jgi:hypothetical protein
MISPLGGLEVESELTSVILADLELRGHLLLPRIGVFERHGNNDVE